MARYFSATAHAGRLYLEGVPDRGPWDLRALVCWDERQVDMILKPTIGDRKATTLQELQEAVSASRFRRPSIKVWIAKGLEKAAREVWDAGRTGK